MSEPFVGRREALEAFARAWSAPERLLVVTGPPGVGKSRLVERALASREVPRADLGSATGLEDALRRIGRALEVSFAPSDTVESVIAHIEKVLGARPEASLWLDDADAVIETLQPFLAAIVRDDAPPTRVVITSGRSRVDVAHRVLPLGPLERDEAVELLVSRARRVRPDFVLSEAQRPSLEALVEQVDALPLAIELIAPRLRLLSPSQLAARLREGSTPMEDALRRAVDRSFELLSPFERDALAQCTVFRDGFYLEAAEAVVDLRDHPGAPDVWTVLEALVDQSLLRIESVDELPDEVRMRFFSAVRDRAAEALGPTRAREVAARHAAYFVRAAEIWDTGIESAHEIEHTARLVVELPNLEAAFACAEGTARARLGLVLHMAYQRRGPFSGQAALVRTVQQLAQAAGDDRLLARSELASARVLRWAADFDGARDALGRGLAAAQRAGDIPTEAGCARNLAAIAYHDQDLDGFRRHLEHALDASKRSGRIVDEVNARNGLGYLYARQDEIGRACTELELAHRLAQETRVPGLIALTQSSLSSIMLEAERFEAAERHATLAIEAYAALGYLRQWALEHLVRAEARLFCDDLAGAHEDADAALRRARWLGLEGPLQRARMLRAKVAFFEQDFGGAEAAFEGTSDRDPRTLGYLGATRAMMGHLDLAEALFEELSIDDPVIRVLRGFVRVAHAKDALLHGDAVDLSELPRSRDRGVEEQRVAELLASVARQIESSGRSTPSSPSGVRLEVASDGRWFRFGGDDGVDLTRRRALRGVLKGLVEQRMSEPGEPMTLEHVLDAGWPGERMTPESGARRVYVTINRLRKLGLGELLLTTGDGYMLTPRVEVVEVSAV